MIVLELQNKKMNKEELVELLQDVGKNLEVKRKGDRLVGDEEFDDFFKDKDYY